MNTTLHRTEMGFCLLLDDGSKFISNNKEIVMAVAAFLDKKVEDFCDHNTIQKVVEPPKKVDKRKKKGVL